MKLHYKAIFALATLTILSSSFAQAPDHEKIFIALDADGIELTETDISELAIGEARTIETDNGRLIDVLRTTDGAEIYVDGELIDLGIDHHGAHEAHELDRHIEIVCDDEAQCAEDIFILEGDESTVMDWHSEDGSHHLVHKEVEITCADDEGDVSCSDRTFLISGDEEIDFDDIHEAHSQGHRTIVIKKIRTSED